MSVSLSLVFLHLTTTLSHSTFLCLPPSASLPLSFSVLVSQSRSLALFVGGIWTPRWWQSPGVARVAAGHSSDLSIPARCPPALLLGIFSSGQGGGWRGHGWSQPPPPTHGAAGAGPQSNRSVSLQPLLCLLVSSSFLRLHLYLLHLFPFFAFVFFFLFLMVTGFLN